MQLVDEVEKRSIIMTTGRRPIVRATSGSVLGMEGHVEKILSSIRQKSEKNKSSLALQKLTEEEAADEELGKKGKVVVYVTSIKAVRETSENCKQVLHTLRAHHIDFTVKDVHLHPDYNKELRERLQGTSFALPQVFAAGNLIGDGEAVRDLNETGELKELLRDYKLEDLEEECELCGGEKFILCQWCGGSKKGIQNSFNNLRCTVCNQNGLQKCPECS